MASASKQLTLIVVGDERAPVRRFQLARRSLSRALLGGGLLLVLLAAVAVDWVRLRIDAVDVEQLRAETSQQAAAVNQLRDEVAGLESEVGQVLELERKVRVIADLPGGILQARTPEGSPEEEAQSGPDLPAGAASEADVVPAAGAEQPADPPGSSAEAPADPERDPVASAGLGPALHGLLLRADALAGQLPEQRESLEALLAGLEGKSQQLASTPSIWPTDGWVTSGYGYRTSPFTGRRQFHSGIDIAADFGTPIVAPAQGRVVYVGRKGAMGKVVEIDHGYGLRTTFGHLSKAHVRRGERVERGAPIGSVGSTGRSTGPHLHYSVARAGRSVNPGDYVIE